MRLAGIATMLVLVACDRKREVPTAPPAEAAVATADAAVAEVVPAGLPRPAVPPDEVAASADAGVFDETPFTTGVVRAAKSIGHTSVVLRLDLGPGVRAAWKPRTRRGGDRYRGEIAAYRLAGALGIGAHVPPALPRALPAAEITKALTDPRDAELFTKEALATGEQVPGALIPWVDDLEFLPLEQEPLWTRCRVWLTAKQSFKNDDPTFLGKLANAEEPERRSLARQASIMILFDYLTANFDRWSGGNVGWQKKKMRLLFIDNDGAFLKNPPKDALARNERLAFAVDRTSKSFVEAVRGLDEASLARAMGVDEAGKPLLSSDVLTGIMGRRKALLAKLEEKRAKNGDEETYFFP